MRTRFDSCAWTPISDVQVATLAKSSANRVADSLAEEVRSQSPIVDGFAPLALAYLAATLDRSDLADTALLAWDAVVARFTEMLSSPSLHGGFTGAAWVAAHLENSAEYACGTPELHDEIEAVLLGYLRSKPQNNFDLIGGLVGFGVYALERWPKGNSRDILDSVVSHLSELARSCDPGRAWLTPARLLPAAQRKDSPGGHWNLGVAHGVPGVIAFLARVHGVVGLSRPAVQLLHDSVDWLFAQRMPSENRMRFRAWMLPEEVSLPVSAPPARLSWCYGDLGIAAALAVTGDCLSRADLKKEAVDLALRAGLVPLEATGVNDHGLCHGSAGVAHLYLRIANSCGSDELRRLAESWVLRTLQTRSDDRGIDGYVTWDVRPSGGEYVRDASFLSGAAGTAMALAAAGSTVAPAWDRVLLTSS